MSDTELRDPQGRLVLPLTASNDTTHLRRAGDLLERQAAAKALDRFNAPDQKFWDYRVRDGLVTLHWRQDGGLSLVAGDDRPETEAWIRDIAPRLESMLASS